MRGIGRYDDHGERLYSDEDLRIGLQYALDLKEDGYKREPFHFYNLNKFIAWCRKQLKQRD